MHNKHNAQRRKSYTGFLFLIFLFLHGTHAIADETLDEAHALVEAGRAEEAYQLLAPLQEIRAGLPDYDYAFAIAALDSGRADEAVFALERVLALQPDHAQARAELARAYFLMGENEAAEAEFKDVLAQQPPPQVRQTISRYLNAIEQRFAEERHRFSGFVELGLGYDSNVNSATSDDTVAVPLLGGLLLSIDDAYQEREDSFANLRAGLNYTHQVNSTTHFLLGGSVNTRRNSAETSYNNDTLDAFTGLRFFQGKNRYTLALQGQGFWLDNEQNRNLTGATGQWDRVINARNQTSFYAQYAELRYPDQETRDVNQQSLGAAWVHSFDMPGAPVLYTGLHGGEDIEQDSDRSDLGRTFWGLRLGGDISLNEKSKLELNARYIKASYGDDDPLFLKTREDTTTDVTLGLQYKLDNAWHLKPQFRYTHNASNIPINDFTRYQAQITARWDFK